MVVDNEKQGIVCPMKRVDIPATETKGGESLVQIVSSSPDMHRLFGGIAAYEAGLRALLGYGVQIDRDPKELPLILDRMRDTMTDVEIPDNLLGPRIHKSVELSLEQANLVHIVAQTMVSEAIRTANLDEAFVREGTDHRREGTDHRPPYSWHETPLDAWQRFETALTPPTPQDSQP